MQTTGNITDSTVVPMMRNNSVFGRPSLSAAIPRRASESQVRIGLALGGGFARGIAHAGVLRVLEQHHIPIHCITGISAGAIIAAAYASGATPEEIARTGCSMRLRDVACLSLGGLGLAGSRPMNRFLERALSTYRFEEMRIPLGVVATDLSTGEPVSFAGTGEVFDPIRASCAYPGLFEPVQHHGRLLVDGAMSMGVPAALARQLGATHVISVWLPGGVPDAPPTNIFQVVSRCFQIMQSRLDDGWRSETDVEIAPDVRGVDWNAFGRGSQLVQAGENAALATFPIFRSGSRPHGLTPPQHLRKSMAPVRSVLRRMCRRRTCKPLGNIIVAANAPVVQVKPALDILHERLQDGRITLGLREVIEHLASHREDEPETWPQYVHACLQDPVCNLLYQDPFTYRAFSKPRGYAGDAVMMDYIYGLGEATEAVGKATPSAARSSSTWIRVLPRGPSGTAAN